jgi:thiol-disulfide isomerase/thioredoxin
MKKKLALIGVIILIISGLRGGFWQQKSLEMPADLVFTTITGKKITAEDLKGKPVVINFWATDCAACIQEIPYLKQLYAKYQPQGLEMLGITMYYDLPNHVVAMVSAKQIPYPVSLDLKAQYAQIFGHIELTPTTLLLNAEGTVVLKVTGLLNIATMEAGIKRILK